ncbi:hypothetical protein [Plantibacter sp. VKM Ac-2885]|uniref:hypothetical protein n=1 Tax=Plantibacter sp. VKM Ac-2885 TaxID=2783828 RepID=UPI001E4CCE7F|nr:hypothetical protein [Plantibacter sp. VKM Ac-2885]
MSGAFSGFTASINNSANSIGSGTLLLTETQGATTCLSSASGTVTAANAGTCASINKFNGTTVAAPNVPYTSTVTLKNNGTAAASSFTLTPSGCTTTANGAVNGTDTAGFCGKVDITIQDSTTPVCVFPAGAATCPAPSQSATLATLGTTPITLSAPLAAGATRTFTFTVMLDSSATNADQGLLASEQLLWTLAA